MVEHHREWHCKNDKGDDPEIEIENERFREIEIENEKFREIEIEMKSSEESKGTKANDTSEYLLMKRIQ